MSPAIILSKVNSSPVLSRKLCVVTLVILSFVNGRLSVEVNITETIESPVT